MTKRSVLLSGRARAEGDAEDLIAWCAATSDLITFREALRRISAERWPSVWTRVADALGGLEPCGAGQPGGVADRARRGQAAARSLKLRMIEQEATARQADDREARARRRHGQLGG